jgi:hypothetical protein
MTAYWPTSVVTAKLTPEQKAEVARAHVGISWPTMRACHQVTSKLPADTSLVIIDGARRVYLQVPSFEQWATLERGGFIQVWDEFGFIMDALH